MEGEKHESSDRKRERDRDRDKERDRDRERDRVRERGGLGEKEEGSREEVTAVPSSSGDAISLSIEETK